MHKLRSPIKKRFKNWKIISCLTNYGKTKQKTQIYGEKNLTATTTKRVTIHCYASLYPTRWRLSHGLTRLYRFYPLKMFGLFLIKIFLYIVWLDLISGFDCLVGEIFFFLRLRGVETINPEHAHEMILKMNSEMMTSIIWVRSLYHHYC